MLSTRAIDPVNGLKARTLDPLIKRHLPYIDCTGLLQRRSLYPQKRTFGCNAISVALGQNRTHALQHDRRDSWSPSAYRNTASRRFLRNPIRCFDQGAIVAAFLRFLRPACGFRETPPSDTVYAGPQFILGMTANLRVV